MSYYTHIWSQLRITEQVAEPNDPNGVPARHVLHHFVPQWCCVIPEEPVASCDIGLPPGPKKEPFCSLFLTTKQVTKHTRSKDATKRSLLSSDPADPQPNHRGPLRGFSPVETGGRGLGFGRGDARRQSDRSIVQRSNGGRMCEITCCYRLKDGFQ